MVNVTAASLITHACCPGRVPACMIIPVRAVAPVTLTMLSPLVLIVWAFAVIVCAAAGWLYAVIPL